MTIVAIFTPKQGQETACPTNEFDPVVPNYSSRYISVENLPLWSRLAANCDVDVEHRLRTLE